VRAPKRYPLPNPIIYNTTSYQQDNNRSVLEQDPLKIWAFL